MLMATEPSRKIPRRIVPSILDPLRDPDLIAPKRFLRHRVAAAEGFPCRPVLGNPAGLRFAGAFHKRNYK